MTASHVRALNGMVWTRRVIFMALEKGDISWLSSVKSSPADCPAYPSESFLSSSMFTSVISSMIPSSRW